MRKGISLQAFFFVLVYKHYLNLLLVAEGVLFNFFMPGFQERRIGAVLSSAKSDRISEYSLFFFSLPSHSHLIGNKHSLG